jgi:hypothetical protein
MREERKRGGNEREIFVYFYMINALFHSRLSHTLTLTLLSPIQPQEGGERKRGKKRKKKPKK